jgi:hypothetical protein
MLEIDFMRRTQAQSREANAASGDACEAKMTVRAGQSTRRLTCVCVFLSNAEAHGRAVARTVQPLVRPSGDSE